MTRSQRRLAVLAAGLVFLLVFCALLYSWGMSRLEGKPRDFWQSLEWAAETLSTTGYGFDSAWSHPAMVLFVVAVQFAGVFLVFLVVPIYLIPFLEERFEKRLPREAPKLAGHVVLYRYGSAVETLLGDLASAKVVPLVVEPDENVARELAARGVAVVAGRAADGVLSRVHLDRARALVLNSTDDDDAMAALIARQSGFEGPVLALVEEPAYRKPITLAGASHVFTPRHVLGAALAARASRKVSPAVAGLHQLGRKLEVAELRVAPSSPLAGRTLGETRLGSELHVAIVGQWVRGRLAPEAGRDTRLEPGGIVLAAGAEENRARLAERLAGAGVDTRRRGRFILAGLGEAGRAAVDVLRTAGEEVTTIDRRAEAAPDHVGDVLDSAILARLEPERSDAVILALDSDSATLFATLVVRDAAPHVPIIARVNEAANVERIHRAGADFALSIAQVAGQILARRILGAEAVALEPDLRLQSFAPRRWPAATLGGLALRSRTRCSAVARERGEELLVGLDEDTEVAAGDVLYLCGSASALSAAASLYVSEEGRGAILE